MDDLAVFGGEPAFSSPLHVGRPHIGNRRELAARFEDLLDRRWLTNDGRYVQEFERGIERYLGVEHCVATSSGTTALQIATRAGGLSGDVLVPSFTFIATPNALAWQGLNPVFCDVDPTTYTIDPDAAENLISTRVTGIVGVHLWGRPCKVDALAALADRQDLRLILDASHAFGCSHRGRMIGTFGDAEVFSFHATKPLNTAEGGAIVTNDGALADRARLMRNFGFADYDRTAGLGINGKMSEFSAAMGLTSLDSLPRFIAANRRNYEGYRAGLANVPGLSLVPHERTERHNYHDVVVEVSEGDAGISRDVVQRVLWEEKVLARRYFYPGAHRMEPYRSTIASAGSTLPVTEHLAAKTLVLPNGGEIRAQEIEGVCELAAFVVENGAEVARRLGRDHGG